MSQDKPSADYDQALADCTAHHAASKTFSGSFLRPHGPFIKEIVDRLGVTSAIDYGCGKGRQYEWVNPKTEMTLEQYWGFPVVKYDPAYPPFAAEPEGPADLVICTHTLGTIPIRDLAWVIDRLYRFANKAIYVAEKIGPVKKKVLSDPGSAPQGWKPAQWMEVLTTPKSPVELTLSVRERSEDPEIGVQVKHYRQVNGEWSAVDWPAWVWER